MSPFLTALQRGRNLDDAPDHLEVLTPHIPGKRQWN
jgi:hypothetical protein